MCWSGRKRAARLLPVILVILVGLGFFWNGWWLWAALIFFFGRFYAEPLDEITPLDPPRKVMAVMAIHLPAGVHPRPTGGFLLQPKLPLYHFT